MMDVLEYLDLYLMDFFSNKAQHSMRKIKLFLVVSAILQSGWILENIRRMFFVKIHVHCPGDPD